MDLSTRRAVGELEKAGKHAVVLCSVGEDRVLEVHSMRDNVIVLIHPTWQKKGRNSIDTVANKGKNKHMELCMCKSTDAGANAQIPCACERYAHLLSEKQG